MKMNMCNAQPLIEECEREYNNTNVEVDFSEYMWMGEELEEFDRQVEEELWEEAFIEACFEEMMAEENNQSQNTRQNQQYNTNNNNYQHQPSSRPSQQQQHHQQYVYDNNMANIEDTMKMFSLSENKVKAEVVKNSCLNPEAPEFVPGNWKR